MSRPELDPNQLIVIKEVTHFCRRNSEDLMRLLENVPDEEDALCLIATGLIGLVEMVERGAETDASQSLKARIRTAFGEPDYISLAHAADSAWASRAKSQLKNYLL